jgi:FG-GAP-like repeat/FG-GAP repeat
MRKKFVLTLGVMTMAAQAAVPPVSFRAPRVYVSGAPQSVALGDFNGDGKLDMAVTPGSSMAGVSPHGVGILLGKGDGTFGPERQFLAGKSSVFVVAGDFNSDGKPDLAVCNNGGDTNNIVILLGNGDGTFRPAANYRAGTGPVAMTAADFNGDGNLDLAVALTGSTPEDGGVAMLLGNGDGTFQVFSPVLRGGPVSSVAAGDFNGDGYLDMALTYPDSNTVAIALGEGTGFFLGPASFATGAVPESVAVGDFNHDGKLDVAVGGGNSATDGTISILLGNGDGTLAAAAISPVGYGVFGVTVADLNGDGYPDVASGPAILLGKGDGTFQPPVINNWGGTSVAAGDLNGDGIPDLVLGDYGVVVLLGKGNGVFRKNVIYPAMPNSNGVSVGDFDADGNLDVAVAGGDGVSILFGNGRGAFTTSVDYSVGSTSSFVAVADFNADGKLDLAVSNSGVSGQGAVSILLGNGDGTFQPPVSYDVGAGAYALAVGDFNGDGKPDLVVTNIGSLGNGAGGTVLLGNGDGTFRVFGQFGTGGQEPTAVAVADFNNDGKMDLAVTCGRNAIVSILLGNGDGTFQAPLSYTVGGDPWSVAAGDFNGDGNTDLAVVSLGNLPVLVLLGNGDGTFASPVAYAVGSGFSVVAGDFNLDGKLDLAVGNTFTAILLGNGDGTFQPAKAFAPGGYLAVGDFNGDGKPDLVTQQVSIMLNATP